MDIRKSLKEASEKVLKKLADQSVKISKEDIERVALISAEDPKLTKIITDIFKKLGDQATITIEDSRTFDTEVEIVEGYEANVGFMSPVFVNEAKKARCVMTDVPVFVSGKKISTIQDISHLQEQLKTMGITSLVIVTEDIEDSILGVYAQSKMIGAFNAVVIRATGDLLKDIEAAVGATRVGNDTGITFQNIDITKHLGKVKKVTCDAHKTVFIPENPSLASKYANVLQAHANTENNSFIKERMEKRIAQLRGSIAILKIGAATDFERVYLKRKAEDAVKAVKAALAEGIVEGGGMALWRIAQSMKPKTIGEQILKKALSAPLQTIAKNCGIEYAELIKNLPEGKGYDAKNDKYVDMLENGIIDPTKVERCALENAVSAATTFITAFCTISDAPEDK
jgi:chaperonin GroEL